MSNPTCSAPDCERDQVTRSLCGSHYQRLRKHGSIDLPPRDCGLCGKSFTPSFTSAQKFCSIKCKNSAHRDSSKKSCTEPDCSRPLRAKGMCSMHWKRAGRAAGLIKNEPWDDRRKTNYQKRRAQMKMVPVESVSPVVVYERDGWMCGICAEPVDKDLKHPDPMSASLDHIHPLAKGGHHTYANTQLGHLVCNIRKNDKVA